MKKEKPGRYDKILSRADKRRPHLMKELMTDKLLKGFGESMVLDIKLLNKDSSTIRVTWSEKLADESSKRDSKKGAT